MKPSRPTIVLATALLLAPCTLLQRARAADSSGEVGAYLQAGAQLKQAMAGRRGVVHQSLPGCIAGLELRAERERVLDERRNRKRIYDDGQAYAAGDSVMVTSVQVTRREIDLLLGMGGYDPAHLNDSPDQMFPGRQYVLEWQIQWLAGAAGLPEFRSGQWQLSKLTDVAAEEQRRELESQRGAAIKEREDAEASALQLARTKLSRVAGARIRVLYDHDIPLADLSEPALRRLLGPYLSLAD